MLNELEPPQKNLPDFIRARRRLIGSIALLIILITGLPLLINTAPTPPKEVTVEVLKPTPPPPPPNNLANTSPNQAGKKSPPLAVQ